MALQKTPDFAPEFRANLPKTGHSLSHYLNMTATTGHLNPVFHTILNPGDTINLGFNFNLRTQPLESAAFGDLTCHTEYFFVPMQLLYQAFDNVFYSVNDQFSSLFNTENGSRKNFPLFDFNDLAGELYLHRTDAVSFINANLPIESVGQSAARLFDLLGYIPDNVVSVGSNSPNVFPYALLAYNAIYQYFYRLDAREKFDQSSFNVDRFYNLNGLVTRDDYNYKNCLIKYRPIGNDYFSDVKVSPIVDVLNFDSKQLDSAKQWLTRNEIDFGSVLHSGGIGNNMASGAGDNSPFDDSLFGNPVTGIQTQFGFRLDTNTDGDPGVAGFNGLDIGTANIRAMFASEKLWSITGRARKNYDDQTLAHFGFKVPHDVKHEITCFGRDESQIHIGEVISTANTDLSPLGEIAGKGYGQQQSKGHKFTAPCHGVVLAIFSVTIRRSYDAGFPRWNVLTDKYDLYQPEYDHLGMQPLFGYEVSLYDPTSTSFSQIVGWQYRYEQWKRRYNRVTGAFRNDVPGSLRSWAPSYTPYVFNAGVTPPENRANEETYKYFMNLPFDANQIFLAQYPNQWSVEFSENWTKIYDFDPFVIDGFIDAKLSSVMSDYSLPRLDA